MVANQIDKEKVVLTNNLATIAFYKNKFFMLVKEENQYSCFKPLKRFTNNMEVFSIFKKDFKFDSSQFENSHLGSKQVKKCILCKRDFQNLSKHLLVDHKILTLFEASQQKGGGQDLDNDGLLHHVIKCSNEGSNMPEVEFDLKAGKVPFSFHFLLQCNKAKPLEYLKQVKIMQTNIKNLLDIETIDIAEIVDHRSKLDTIALEDQIKTDKQYKNHSLI